MRTHVVYQTIVPVYVGCAICYFTQMERELLRIRLRQKLKHDG